VVILISMKTAISIPDALFNAAERLAKRMGISRSELYQKAVEAYLKKYRQESVTEAIDKVYASMSDNGKLDSFLERMQFASLEEEEW